MRKHGLENPLVEPISTIGLFALALYAGIKSAIWLSRGNPPYALLYGFVAAYSSLGAVVGIARLAGSAVGRIDWNSRALVAGRMLSGAALVLYALVALTTLTTGTPGLEAPTALDNLREILSVFVQRAFWESGVALFLGIILLKSVGLF